MYKTTINLHRHLSLLNGIAINIKLTLQLPQDIALMEDQKHIQIFNTSTSH